MMTFRPCPKRKAIGIGCLALGPVGLILPIMPGFIFMALGTFILRDQYAWAHRGVGMVNRRWPHLLPGIEERESRAMAWCDRQTAKVKGVFRRTPNP